MPAQYVSSYSAESSWYSVVQETIKHTKLFFIVLHMSTLKEELLFHSRQLVLSTSSEGEDQEQH